MGRKYTLVSLGVKVNLCMNGSIHATLIDPSTNSPYRWSDAFQNGTDSFLFLNPMQLCREFRNFKNANQKLIHYFGDSI